MISAQHCCAKRRDRVSVQPEYRLAENANVNGVEFKFDTEVTDLKKSGDIWEVHTNQGVFETKYVVNAAGVYADKFHNMVSEKKIHITPRRGDYCLLDKSAGSHVSHTVFALPGKYGKGILISPTVHGNLLLGPTAIDIEDKEGTNTTREGLDQVIAGANLNVKNIPMRQVITSFAGLRAHEDGHEFIIEEVADAKDLSTAPESSHRDLRAVLRSERWLQIC